MKRSLQFIGALMFSTITYAQATYTDIDPDEQVDATYAGDSYVIDMDGDATPDLIVFGLKTDTSVSGFPVTITGVAVTTLNNTEVVGATQAIGMETVLVADIFNGGDDIDGSLAYVNSSTPSIFSGVGLSADASGFTTLGNFTGTSGYFGLSFTIGSDVHYGWVKCTVDASSNNVVLEAYGYNQTANTVSVAGDLGNGVLSSIEETEEVNMYSANNQLFINGDFEGVLDLSIYNLLGAEVLSSVVYANEAVDLSTIPNGTYLVSYSINGKRTTIKIAK